MTKSQLSIVLLALGVAVACSSSPGSDAGPPDSGSHDSGVADSGPMDSGVADSGMPDSGAPDSGVADSGMPDSGTPDSGIPDSGPPDSGLPPDDGGAWQTAVLVQSDLSTPGNLAAEVLGMHIAGDGFGNAIAVWDQIPPDAGDSSEPYVIYTSSYGYDAGWTTPVRLDLTDSAAGGNFNDTPLIPDIGYDAAGNALVVWMQLDWSSGADQLWMATHTAQGWQTPVAAPYPGVITRPALAVAASGDALIAWELPGGGGEGVYAVRRLANGALPTTPSLIEAIPVITPRDALSSDGQTGLVAYSANNEVHVSQSLLDGGWTAPAHIGLLGDGGLPPVVQLQVAAANGGTGFVAWSTSADNNNTRVHVSHFEAGAWSADVDLAGALPGTSLSPSLGVDSAGNGIVTWIQWSGATEYVGTSTVYANRYVAGTGWGTAVQVSGALAEQSYEYDTALSVRPDGTAVVIYSEGNTPKMMAAVFTPAGGWAHEQVIDTSDPVDSALHSITTFLNTRSGAVCWTSPSSATAIWSHTTAAGSPVTAYAATLR